MNRRLARIRRTSQVVCVIYVLLSILAFGLVQEALGWAIFFWVLSLPFAALLWHLLNVEERVAKDG